MPQPALAYGKSFTSSKKRPLVREVEKLDCGHFGVVNAWSNVCIPVRHTLTFTDPGTYISRY